MTRQSINNGRPQGGGKNTKNVLGNAFVRVLGERLGRFIEFEYCLNDEDLTVELVLPIRAFEEFCIAQNASIITDKSDTNAEEILWRLKNPGLLKRVNRH